jgi:heptosyltransferase-3
LDSGLKTAKKKRFALLRRIFWTTYYGFYEWKKRFRWALDDVRQFVRIQSHVIQIYPSFLKHYLQLYRIRRQLYKKQPSSHVIGICLIEHMGDVVSCEPVARYIRRQNPNAYIVWIVGRRYRELLAYHPALNEILGVQCLTEWMLLKNAGFFDQIIELHPEGRFCLICWIPLKKSTGDTRITIDNYYDFGSLQTSFCLGAGLPVLNEQPRVHVPAVVTRRIARLRLPNSYVVVHCLSNERARDWSNAKWRELAERILAETAANIVEVGSSPVLEGLAAPRYLNLCGKLTLLGTAEVIRSACVFVGVDSGPAHLANAVGTDGVILLGAYRRFKRYLPYTGNFTQTSHADLIYSEAEAAAIAVDQVYAAVRRRLASIDKRHTEGD